MPRRCAPPPRRRDAGFTLIELMVTLVITLLVLMAGLSFYLMSRSSYVTIDDNANLEERGNFAISIMTRLMRQTAYVPVVSDTGGMLSVTSAMLTGLDNCSTPNDSETLSCGPGTAVNGSDAVMIGRGAIRHPWIFRESLQFLNSGQQLPPPSMAERIRLCREHLHLSVEHKGERGGVIGMRRHYAGYFRDLPQVSRLRAELVQQKTVRDVEDRLAQLSETGSTRETAAAA